MDGATVQNLTLNNVNIDKYDATIGALAGQALNSQLTNIAVSGQIVTPAPSGASTIVGGIVGSLTVTGPVVQNLRSSVVFGSATRAGYIGGVAGQVSGGSGTLDRAIFSGTMQISGGSYAGGIAGILNSATIANSLNKGALQVAGNHVGGITGLMSGTSRVTRSGNDAALTVAVASGGGGVVGTLASGVSPGVFDSYSRGLITIHPGLGNRVGGIVGIAMVAGPAVSNSYFAGSFAGPLAGNGRTMAGSGANLAYSNNFFDNTLTSAAAVGGVGVQPPGNTGASTSTMQTPATFSAAGWSNVIWDLATPGQYPKLFFE